jgi:hypothetical protein
LHPHITTPPRAASIRTATQTGPSREPWTLVVVMGTEFNNNGAATTRPVRSHRIQQSRNRTGLHSWRLIDGTRYNMTAWAKAHPGGEKHSAQVSTIRTPQGISCGRSRSKTYSMLSSFAIVDRMLILGTEASVSLHLLRLHLPSIPGHVKSVPRWGKSCLPMKIHVVLTRLESTTSFPLSLCSACILATLHQEQNRRGKKRTWRLCGVLSRSHGLLSLSLSLRSSGTYCWKTMIS